MPENTIEKLAKLEAKQHRLEEAVRNAECDVADIDEDIQELAREVIAPMFPEMDRDGIIYSSGWGWVCESKENPFDRCVYNEIEDVCRDDCLFCHQPDERK